MSRRLVPVALLVSLFGAVFALTGWWGLATLLGLNALVLLHEIGHLVVARRCGVGASEVSVGLGPVVAEWRGRSGRPWRLRALPFGGYVRTEASEGLPGIPLDEAAPLRRFFVYAAGPAASFASAWVLAVVLLAGVGLRTTGDVIELAGRTSVLQPGDRIVAVDGVAASSWDQVPTGSSSVTITRRGHETTLVLVDGTGDAQAGTVVRRLHPVRAVSAGSQVLAKVIARAGTTVIGIAPAADDESARPSSVLGMADAGRAAGDQFGAGGVLMVLALLSIVLGLFNLLPIPPLDGGGMLVATVEGVVRRFRPDYRVDTVWLTSLSIAVAGLLIGLTVWGLVSDIVMVTR